MMTSATTNNTDSLERLEFGELLQLSRWNTPSIYNGWEQITQHDICRGVFNAEETRDFMPHMGPMVGYAVTVVFEPSNRNIRRGLRRGVTTGTT